MAKDKTKPADSLLNDMLKDVAGHPAQQEAAAQADLSVKLEAAEKRATDLSDRIGDLDKFLAKVMPEFHHAAQMAYAHNKVHMGERFAAHYRECRTLMGAAGVEIDKAIRNG